LPQERVLFSGDLVEYGATPYAGDAYFKDWPRTLEALAALGAEKLVPGRGAALTDRRQVAEGLANTRAFVSELYAAVASGARDGKDLRAIYRDTYAALHPKYGGWVIFDHCMPFDVTRAYDEATAHPDPRIWTAARDQEMWQALAD
jgi:glyoxylase-like metal-dependent hydrolase (beta-lactamase superfamily II)